MATNEILPFAYDGAANVLTQAEYQALADRAAGMGAGLVPSVKLNKVLRQTTLMSAALAQVVVDTIGQDVLDNGDVAALAAKLTSAFQATSVSAIAFGNEAFTATAGQTLFTLTSHTYVPGANQINVYQSGVRLRPGTDYTETSSIAVTLTFPAEVGEEYDVLIGNPIGSIINALASPAVGQGASMVGKRNTLGLFDSAVITADAALDELGYKSKGQFPCALTTSMTGAQVDAAIAAAQARAVAAGGGVVMLPAGSYPSQTLPAPTSNIFFRAIGGRGTTTLYRDNPAAGGHWCTRNRDGVSVSNYGWIDVAFDGKRANFANVSSEWYRNAFYFAADSSAVYRGIYFIGCDAKNIQQDFVRVEAWSTTSGSNKVRVIDGTCTTEPAYVYTSTTDAVAIADSDARQMGGDHYRQQQVYELYVAPTDPNGADAAYGRINFVDSVYAYNKCSSIRTAGDMKRGSQRAWILFNETYSMHDCHHSVDGAFDWVVTGNMGEQASAVGTNTNFIEFQGERGLISFNSFNGGGNTLDGIFGHDYQGPWGTPGGHGEHGQVSKLITIEGNTIRNVAHSAMRLLNIWGGAVRGNTISDCGYYGVLHAVGASRYASDGTTRLYGKSMNTGGNYIDSVGTDAAFLNQKPGVSCQHSNAVPWYPDVLGSNRDASGRENYYVPSGVARTVGPSVGAATTYCRFVREHAHLELNPNRWLDVATATTVKFWDNSGGGQLSAATQITAAANLPWNVPQAATLSDADGTLRTARLISGLAVSAGDVVYVRFRLRRNTSTAEGLLVQEKTGTAGFLTSNYIAMDIAPTNWTEYLARFLVTQGDNCQISLVPATNFNNAAATGASDWADVRIGINQVPA